MKKYLRGVLIIVSLITSVTFAQEKTEKEKETVLKSKYVSINTTEKVIALTFDDGPLQATTPRLLDILKKNDAKATFFVVGNMVKWHKDTLKRITNEGHEIANHTTDHPDISTLGNEALIANLKQLNKVIEAETGVTPKFFRPPFGTFKEHQIDLMYKNLGLSTAMWDLDPQDWKSPGASVVASRVVNGAKPGSIVVMHDIMGGTIDAMPSILSQLKAKGYRFVTLSELIKYDQPKKDK